MNGKHLKHQIKRLKKKIGADQLKRELVLAGLGFSTSEKWVNGTYESEPGERISEGVQSVLNKYKEAQAS